MTGMESEVLQAIHTLALLIFAAKVTGEIFQRLGIAPVVGELSAGILLAPTFLGGIQILGHTLIVINEGVTIFAEVGAIILLFLVGLDTRFSEFKKVGPLATAVAIGGVILPFFLGYEFVVSRGLPKDEALLVGATLTATSIAITVKTLRDLGKDKEPRSMVLLSAAVIDDVLGLVILAIVLAMIGGGSVTLATTALIAGKAIGFWLFLTLAGVVFLPSIVRRVVPLIRTEGTPEALATALCFGYAYLAGLAGLAPILGAFAAGMAIGETRAMDEIRAFAEKLSFLMAPLFFTVIGTLVDLSQLSILSVIFALQLVVLAVVGKVIGCGLPTYVKSRNVKDASVIGVGMVSRGEVGLIIAGIGATSGIFSQEVFSATVLMVVVTTVLTPIALKMIYTRK